MYRKRADPNFAPWVTGGALEPNVDNASRILAREEFDTDTNRTTSPPPSRSFRKKLSVIGAIAAFDRCDGMDRLCFLARFRNGFTEFAVEHQSVVEQRSEDNFSR